MMILIRIILYTSPREAHLPVPICLQYYWFSRKKRKPLVRYSILIIAILFFYFPTYKAKHHRGSFSNSFPLSLITNPYHLSDNTQEKKSFPLDAQSTPKPDPQLSSSNTVMGSKNSNKAATGMFLILLSVASLHAASSYVPRSSSAASFRRRPFEPVPAGYAIATDPNPAAALRRPRCPSVFVVFSGKLDKAGFGEYDNDDEEDDEIFTPTMRNSSSNNNHNNHEDSSPPAAGRRQETTTTTTTATTATTKNNGYDYLDDLTPPPVNFARNSVLFSENPSTKARNNPPLTAWRFSRTYLPAIVTGAWPWRDTDTLDERPLSALYNVLIVRLPVLAVAASYLYQKIARGHDLVVDLGFDAHGPQAVPPVVVLGILVLILL